MGSFQKLPAPNIPLNQVWAAVRHPNGEPLDIAITQYPYWTVVSILRINQINNERSNRSFDEP